jgi:hypothetical protein
MSAKSSGAERARRHRERKRRGTVIVQDLPITQAEIRLLVAQGWLEAEASDDPAKVRSALVKLLNDTLKEPETVLKFTQEPQPKRRALRAMQSVLSFGLL